MTSSWGAVGRRASIYTAVLGVAVGSLLTGLLVPFVEGEREGDRAVAAEGFADAGGASGFQDTATGDTATPSATDDAGAGAPAEGAAAPTGDAAAGAGAPAGAASPAPAAAAGSAPLRATDQGVTASSIKVAFLLLDLGQTGRVGVNTTGVSPQQQRQAIEAYVQELNERGGINGRTIEPFFRVFDVTSPDDQRAACLAATEDAKAFAVVAMSGYANDAVLCVTEQHRTPLIVPGQATSREFYARSQGRLVTLQSAGDRMMRNWVAELDAAGQLRGRTIGILSGEAKNARDVIDGALVPALRAGGHKVGHIARFSQNQATAASQIPTEVQQMRTAGVDTVLITTSFLNSVPFVQTAERQMWRPRYLQSEFSGGTSDFETQGMPASFDGAMAMTSQRFGDWRSNAPEPPFATQCRQIYEQRTGQRLPQNNGDESNPAYPPTITACDMLKIFEKAAGAAGPELTRASFAAAVQRGFKVDAAQYFAGALRAGKTDKVDMLRFNKYVADCGCWRNVDQPRPARFR